MFVNHNASSRENPIRVMRLSTFNFSPSNPNVDHSAPPPPPKKKGPKKPSSKKPAKKG